MKIIIIIGLFMMILLSGCADRGTAAACEKTCIKQGFSYYKMYVNGECVCSTFIQEHTDNKPIKQYGVE